ncbi:MAG: two-component system, OmpR family, phosphate regulon sensor histidine kinase PhoR [Chloroflexi bacterium]|jgi:two-component system phosphate regulon sensor histidine kinase PhoR|nr:MAG: two-component system, OmpR family, phosphate regulon sensor histidine kinase PhoR [Chloroflexota bacterium]
MATLIVVLVAAVLLAGALGLVWHYRRGHRPLLQEIRNLEMDAQRLSESQDDAQQVVDAFLKGAPGTFLVVNHQRSIQRLSPQAEDLFSTTEVQAVGHSIMSVARDHQINDLIGLVLEGGQVQEATFEHRPTRRILQNRAFPILDGGQRVVGALLSIQDVTELRRLEQVRQEFVTNISHELRTPMASIKAMMETLQEGALDDRAVAPDFLRRIDVEVDHLTQLVRELSLLSSIESGLAPLKRTPTKVEGLLKSAVDRATAQAQRRRVSLSVETPADLPSVFADASRIEQVLLNLLNNAVRFTGPGGSVTTSATLLDGFVQVSVKDTGVGISRDDLPRVFERFYKVDKARSGEGTGLGLALVKHIILSHGGDVSAESEEGRGSAFSFTLPLAQEADSP